MIERATLRPDYDVPRVIKGGWQLAGGHGTVDRVQATRDMRAFLDAGITAFDCADIYTGVEELIGEFISSLRTDCGGDVASRVQVHTKLVPDLGRLDDFSARDVEAIVDRSLLRLKIDRLHLLQFFWWDMSRGRPLDVLPYLKVLQAKGKIHHLGVTNWDADVIAAFAEHGLDIISAQVQYSLLDARPKGAFADWCIGNRTSIFCYGVLAGGFLTNAWLDRPDPGYEFENRSLVKYRLIIDEFGGWDLFQRLLKQVQEIALVHDVDIATVASCYMLDQPGVAAVILGSRTARALPVATRLTGLKLSQADRDKIEGVLSHAVGPTGSVYGLESDRTGPHGRIMKYNLNAADA